MTFKEEEYNKLAGSGKIELVEGWHRNNSTKRG